MSTRSCIHILTHLLPGFQQNHPQKPRDPRIPGLNVPRAPSLGLSAEWHGLVMQPHPFPRNMKSVHLGKFLLCGYWRTGLWVPICQENTPGDRSVLWTILLSWANPDLMLYAGWNIQGRRTSQMEALTGGSCGLLPEPPPPAEELPPSTTQPLPADEFLPFPKLQTLYLANTFLFV